MAILVRSRLFWSIVCSIGVLGMMASSLPAARIVSAGQQQPSRDALDLYAFDYRTSPIKMKTVRNLNKPDWIEKMEIHVENVSTKPIYSIEAFLIFPEVRMGDRKYTITLRYGDQRLIYSEERATANDKPIEPKEIHKFIVSQNEVGGFVSALKYLNMLDSQVTKIEIRFTAVSFGDGTGFLLRKKPRSTSYLPPTMSPQVSCFPTFLPQCQSYVYLSWKCLNTGVDPPIACPDTNVWAGGGDNPDAACYKDRQLGFIFCGPNFWWCPNDPYVPPCQPPCPDPTDENPHLEADSTGICRKIYTCGKNQEGCTEEGKKLECTGGRTNPHWVCEYGGCTEKKSCGYTSDACRNCNAPECENVPECPCLLPLQRPYNECTPEGKCVIALDANGNFKCGGPNECRFPNCACGECENCPTQQPCVPRIESGCMRSADPFCGCPDPNFPIREGECCCSTTPIIIDVNDNGYSLTNAMGGVHFDFNNDGVKEKISWTSLLADDAFLVLDRNGNGMIDAGAELFGNTSPQPLRDDANGFLALGEYDRLAKGGNKDGQIDNRDAVFSFLMLWRDTNHNGFSDDGELLPLSAANITTFSLEYEEVKQVDQFGNWFRYRAVIKSEVGLPERWAWDVYLTKE